MKITCKNCGIVDKPHKCPHSKRKTDRKRVDNKIYESKEYRKVREQIRKDLDKLCLWSLYVDGKIISGTQTHHIIEVLEDISRSKDKDNLITLSYDSHKLVHKLYDTSPSIKKRVQEILFLMKKDYLSGNIQYGKYKKEIDKYTPYI